MRDVEETRVERWRIEQFQRMGFSGSAAILLHEWQVDLHIASDLIERGCLPHVAMRILRPLDVFEPASSSSNVPERIAEYVA